MKDLTVNCEMCQKPLDGLFILVLNHGNMQFEQSLRVCKPCFDFYRNFEEKKKKSNIDHKLMLQIIKEKINNIKNKIKCDERKLEQLNKQAEILKNLI